MPTSNQVKKADLTACFFGASTACMIKKIPPAKDKNNLKNLLYITTTKKVTNNIHFPFFFFPNSLSLQSNTHADKGDLHIKETWHHNLGKLPNPTTTFLPQKKIILIYFNQPPKVKKKQISTSIAATCPAPAKSTTPLFSIKSVHDQ